MTSHKLADNRAAGRHLPIGKLQTSVWVLWYIPKSDSVDDEIIRGAWNKENGADGAGVESESRREFNSREERLGERRG